MELEVIIGLEVHAQMSTKTKMFCGCNNDAFGKLPNTTVCPVCMGHPGTLPVVNKVAVEKAIKAGLAINCTINTACHFDRKHYFYPDLPAGFQISQYDFPIASKGTVEFDMHDDSGKVMHKKTCGITRLHMENDAGKLTHRGATTLCDYNRAGTPLMEIVTEPDLRSADEASAFAQELRKILIAVDASDADMFKGMMRFDASISLREKGSDTLNPRSEIKNLNSFKSLERALAYEEKRLRTLWKETGGPLTGDITVGWLDDEEKTRLLRDKENAMDYRYFPEPDIPSLNLEEAYIQSIQKSLPKLPRVLKQEYEAIGLDEKQANQLIDQPMLRTIFDAVYNDTNDLKRTSSVVLTQMVGFLNTHEKNIEQAPSVDNMLELVRAIMSGSISGNAGKEVLETMITTGKNASDIIADSGMKQISDEGELASMVAEAIAANPQAVEDIKAGKQQAIGSIIGYIMKQTKGQANPGLVNKLVQEQVQ